ncbi:MAG: hypothetical protein CVU54_01845 [Deltaproteobacteria bacterium HGW-Deltaproteobacteria-12]|jgi:hypothetical protein|nr:MAG: hypothetical protein CVU54_01845 [Deltaproteobacteria bacterium HGW-Deltaproteobacteria-12]
MDWRNPFEGFRDKYLSFKNVKAYQLFLIRKGFIPYSLDRVAEYSAKVREIWGNSIPEDQLAQFCVAYRDMGVKRGVQPWITKFFNARLSFMIGVSIWKSWLPLLFVGLSIRYSAENYFQAGLGFGPEGTLTDGVYERTTICGKFRFGNFIDEYIDGGNFDVYGIYEGMI